jgi:hypothetical protein
LGRGEWGVKDTGPAAEIPTVDPPPKKPREEPRFYPRLEFITVAALTAIPPREFYLGKQYQRGAVSGTMAPGGRGKSSLVLVEAVSMAVARKLLFDVGYAEIVAYRLKAPTKLVPVLLAVVVPDL